jgi:hypothetical protein
LCFSICLKDWKWSSQAGYTTGHQSMPRKWKSLWSKDETGKKKEISRNFRDSKTHFLFQLSSVTFQTRKDMNNRGMTYLQKKNKINLTLNFNFMTLILFSCTILAKFACTNKIRTWGSSQYTRIYWLTSGDKVANQQ